MHDDDPSVRRLNEIRELAQVRRDIVKIMVLLAAGLGYLVAILASAFGVHGAYHGLVLLIVVGGLYLMLRNADRRNREP